MHSLTKTVWALSLPILFAEVGETLIYATDTAFLGRVGTTPLAAIGLADTVIEMAIVPALGLVEAMQMVVARRAGERRDEAVGQTFNRAVMLVVLVGAVVSVALKLGSPAVSELLVGSRAVAAALDDFLQIAAYGLVFTGLNFAIASLFVGLGRSRVLIGASLVLVLTNLGLSYALVLGNLGSPKLGITGAAYALVGAEALTFVYLTLQLLRKASVRRYGIFRPKRPSTPLVRPLVRLALPVALQALVQSARWFGFFLIVEQVSDQALAWSSVAYACYVVASIPTFAFGESVYTLVSNLIGRGQPDRIVGLVRRAVWSTYIITAPLIVLVVLSPDAVLSIFTSDAGSEGARGATQVAALGLLVVIPAELWLAAVLGTGDADMAFLIDLLLTVLLLVGAAVSALVFELPLEYVWVSVPMAAGFALYFSYVRLAGGRWRQHV